MTASEIIAERQGRKDWLIIFVGGLAAAVLVISVVLAINVARTSGVTRQVDDALRQTRAAICRARAQIIRTPPQTLREYRILEESLSQETRKSCPDLDYEKLLEQAASERRRLDSGTTPQQIIAEERDGASPEKQ